MWFALESRPCGLKGWPSLSVIMTLYMFACLICISYKGIRVASFPLNCLSALRAGGRIAPLEQALSHGLSWASDAIQGFRAHSITCRLQSEMTGRGAKSHDPVVLRAGTRLALAMHTCSHKQNCIFGGAPWATRLRLRRRISETAASLICIYIYTDRVSVIMSCTCDLPWKAALVV